MNRTLLAIGLFIVLGFSVVSCNKNENKCWLLKAKRGGATIEYYLFASQNQLDAKVLELKSKGYVVTFKQNSSYKTDKDCNSNNENLWEDFNSIINSK
ncbi:MAG: hypothetical protein MJZ95_03960 [Paludibacteraceae bacterium]|nr:hypothetical protein [Paludibacteraceae bacterium]